MDTSCRHGLEGGRCPHNSVEQWGEENASIEKQAQKLVQVDALDLSL